MRRFQIGILTLATLAVLAAVFALPQAAQAQSPLIDQALRLETPIQKRNFLRARLFVEVLDVHRRQHMINQLEQLGDRELDTWLAQYVANISRIEEQQQFARDQAYRDSFGRSFRRQGIGYAPVITTLPSGTSLNAGGVISNDGRHVRVNAQPFFSQVGPVTTFNPVTGETRRYPAPQQGYGTPYNNQFGNQYGTPLGNGQFGGTNVVQPIQSAAPQSNVRRTQQGIEVWHDGLRTRYGPRP